MTTLTAFRPVALDGIAPARAAAGLGLSLNAVLVANSKVLKRLPQEAKGMIE